MRLLKTEPQRGRKIKLYLEGGESILLSERDFSSFSFQEGEEIEEGVYRSLLDGILLPAAKRKAMDYLTRMDRSRQELYSKLAGLGYPDEVTEKAVLYVESFHYLDDARYAGNYVEWKRGSKSRYEMKMELRKKGIAEELIEDALSKNGVSDDSEAIQNLIRKKCKNSMQEMDWKERQKLVAYLARKGFSFDEIQKNIEE